MAADETTPPRPELRERPVALAIKTALLAEAGSDRPDIDFLVLARAALAAIGEQWRPWPPPTDLARDEIDVRGRLRDCGAGYQFNPTHWQPLPPPPGDRRGERDDDRAER